MHQSYKLIPMLLLLLSIGGGHVLAQSWQEGMLHLEREQPGKARQVVKKLMAQEPQKADNFVYGGIVYLETESADTAAQLFQKAATLDAKSALAQVGLGYFYQQKGQAQESAAAYARALQLAKNKDVNLLHWLVYAQLQQEKPPVEEVLGLLEKALKVAEQPELYILKGDTQLEKGEGGPAVSSYEKAVKLDPRNAKALTRIAKIYSRTKNYPLVVQYLQQATAADAAYAPAFKELGETYYQMRQAKEAAASYKHYLALTEDKHSARMRGGYFLYLAKDYGKASELFDEVLRQEPNNAIILKYQAYSLLEAGQLPQAEEMFKRYFAQVPVAEQDALDAERYGRLLVKQQREAEAVEQYKLVLQKQPQHEEALQALGDLHLKLKAYQASAQAYEQLLAVRKQPMAQDYFALGKAYYYGASYPQADSAFSKLLELQPQLLAASLWKARALSNLDPDSEKGLAKPYYEQVIEKAAADAAKYKNELKESYSYLGYYYYLKAEIATSKDYWIKVKAIDPQDAKAANALKALNP